MIKKTTIILALILIQITFYTFVVYAQEKSAMIVVSSNQGPYKNVVKGFTSYLKKKRLCKDISVEILSEDTKDALTGKIFTTKPDVVLVMGTKPLDFASGLPAKGIPVISCVISGEKRLKHPKITFITMVVPPKLKISKIREILPGVKMIGMLYSPQSEAYANGIADVCSAVGVGLVKKKVLSTPEFASALEEVFAGGIDCFLVVTDAKLYNSQTMKMLLFQSFSKNVPVVGFSKFFSKAGALLSIECDYVDLGRQAGEFAERIFGGENTGRLGISEPEKVEYSVNLVVAKKMNLLLPNEIINGATELFN